MAKATKYVKVMIGRFQPLHNGHLKCMRAAIDTCDLFVVVIGSAQRQERSQKNPFDSSERHDMIWLSLTPAERAKTVILMQKDLPGGDAAWVKMVKSEVRAAAIRRFGKDVRFHFTLVGCHKGADTYYLSLYKGWSRDLIPVNEAMNATDVRKAFFNVWDWAADGRTFAWVLMVPPAVAGWLQAFADFNHKHWMTVYDTYKEKS